jgi:hypothetical protein
MNSPQGRLAPGTGKPRELIFLAKFFINQIIESDSDCDASEVDAPLAAEIGIGETKVEKLGLLSGRGDGVEEKRGSTRFLFTL